MRQRLHRISRWLVLGSLVLTSLLGYLSSQILDEDSFASLLGDSLAEPEVRSLLAEKAIDVAVDASNADAALADVLPDDIALVASPAIELAKPTVADAGAALLGVDAVGASVETAARSVHRQTINAVLADEDVDVTLNALPVLVVVADEIAGDAGARAVVGLDLPDSATAIELGSNQSPLWSAVRTLAIAAGLAFLALVASIITFFVTAPSGRRLEAVRVIGWTWIVGGVIVLLIGWSLLLAGAAAAMALLSPGEAITFSSLSIGGVSVEGSLALSSVLLRPLISSARQSIIVGGVLIGIAHLLGGGSLAVAARESIRRFDVGPLRSALEAAVPTHLRSIRLAIWIVLGVLLLAWPGISARSAITVSVLAGVLLLLLALRTNPGPIARNLRAIAELDVIEPSDRTERSERGSWVRTRLAVVMAIVALVWPSYIDSDVVLLGVITAALMALSHWWEGRPARAEVPHVELVDDQAGGWTPRRVALLGAAAIVCLVVLFVDGEGVPEVSASELESGAPGACNGHAELCDVPLDLVALAGTHNSMSSSELGWELANHGPAIPAQLDGGIRALLIDVLEWTAATDLDAFSDDPAARQIADAALAGDTPPEDGLWMCHALCQLGGTPFRDFLGDLRAFVETHPDEVIVVIIQDETDAGPIKQAIADAGLVEFALAHEPGTPWPTLGEMITSGERLVFLAENEADPDGWYQLAFDGNVSETGFSYALVEDFDCAANRGGDDGAFFMVNHWVETGLPIPEEADTVNSAEVLRDRAAECERVRGRNPGIIAVNFWERGDLLEIVDELNGVG